MINKKLQDFEYNIFRKIDWSDFVFTNGSKDEKLLVNFDDENKIMSINSKKLFSGAVSSIVADEGMDENGNINRFGEQLEMAYDIFMDTNA
jgi:hypothetical protein